MLVTKINYKDQLLIKVYSDINLNKSPPQFGVRSIKTQRKQINSTLFQLINTG